MLQCPLDKKRVYDKTPKLAAKSSFSSRILHISKYMLVSNQGSLAESDFFYQNLCNLFSQHDNSSLAPSYDLHIELNKKTQINYGK